MSLFQRYSQMNRDRTNDMIMNRVKHSIYSPPIPGPEEQFQQTPAIALPDANDPFVILGVNVRSTRSQVTAAYHRACKRTHPDHGGSEAAFRRVEKAYRTILERHFPEYADEA
jgi:DnaJ domain